jgi:sugar/nucleoside kinase (ribokinase family)
MRHTLQQEQVDVSHMRLDDQHRTSVVVDLDDQGERTFTFMVRPSADLFLAEEDLPQFAANSGCTSAPSRSAPSPAAALPSRRWRTSNVPVAG